MARMSSCHESKWKDTEYSGEMKIMSSRARTVQELRQHMSSSDLAILLASRKADK